MFSSPFNRRHDWRQSHIWSSSDCLSKAAPTSLCRWIISSEPHTIPSSWCFQQVAPILFVITNLLVCLWPERVLIYRWVPDCPKDWSIHQTPQSWIGTCLWTGCSHYRLVFPFFWRIFPFFLPSFPLDLLHHTWSQLNSSLTVHMCCCCLPSPPLMHHNSF